ncbi:hypothetical protein [Kitasatospora azatica]|uniref:hypothetical protein n=1 Tax=Kitasatospora azatica TaxID=58347 RepID=UPI000560F80E|nr:hypothetical protein [Kitasatospora azatica]
MNVSEDFPQDLLDLEAARVAARREIDVYVRTVEVARRAAFPGPEQAVERGMWPDEQVQRWHELRAAYAVAAAAVKAHPVLVAAEAERRLWPVEEKLRGLVPQVEVFVRPDTAAGGEEVVVVLGGIEQHASPV